VLAQHKSAILTNISDVVVQPHRFDILEDVGCYPVIYTTLPAYFLVYMWPVLLGSISFVYSGKSPIDPYDLFFSFVPTSRSDPTMLLDASCAIQRAHLIQKLVHEHQPIPPIDASSICRHDVHSPSWHLQYLHQHKGRPVSTLDLLVRYTLRLRSRPVGSGDRLEE